MGALEKFLQSLLLERKEPTLLFHNYYHFPRSASGVLRMLNSYEHGNSSGERLGRLSIARLSDFLMSARPDFERLFPDAKCTVSIEIDKERVVFLLDLPDLEFPRQELGFSFGYIQEFAPLLSEGKRLFQNDEYPLLRRTRESLEAESIETQKEMHQGKISLEKDSSL